MKRLFLLLTGFFVLASFSSPLSAEERILSFDSVIQVLEDGAIEVRETIVVRAEGREIQRGIFRDLPTLYRTRWGLRQEMPFRVLNTTKNGKGEPHKVEKHRAGIRIRIGRADRKLQPGEYTYTIRYRSEGQLLFHDEFDELYWNVTGNEWGFPIDRSSAKIILPTGIEVRSIEGYIGEKGSKEPPASASSSQNEGTVTTGRVLAPGEGLTISITWPSGFLKPEAYKSSIGSLLLQNFFAIGGLLLLALMLLWHFIAWIRVGRDPRAGQIIPQFSPPPGFSPAAVRMLEKMSFDNGAFGAAVMGLGVKGVLQIEEDDKVITLRKTNEDPNEPLTPDEQKLFTQLLGSGRSIRLKQSNHRTLSSARTALKESLSKQLEKTHFLTNARYWVPGFLLSLLAVLLLILNSGDKAGAGFMALWISIWTVGTGALVSSTISKFRSGSKVSAMGQALFSIPFVLGWFGGMFAFFSLAGLLASVAFLVAIVINVLFYHLIKAPTHLGRKVLDHIEGLKHYLSVAEADRLAGFSGPQKTPELFEKLLPYAHALDVEQKWSEQFTEVLARAGEADGHRGGYRPDFYSGTHTGLDRAMGASALGGALTSALTSASTSPSSSGGGSGGGGSSGGGGGGGGGGGW
ncbi:MAG: DUF2207 domain-containing protein [Verrucomicrobiales bacterium]|nr:DUF2207 domain-containing protein [Verrucomicrobiales bacterium]